MSEKSVQFNGSATISGPHNLDGIIEKCCVIHCDNFKTLKQNYYENAIEKSLKTNPKINSAIDRIRKDKLKSDVAFAATKVRANTFEEET